MSDIDKLQLEMASYISIDGHRPSPGPIPLFHRLPTSSSAMALHHSASDRPISEVMSIVAICGEESVDINPFCQLYLYIIT